MKSLSLPSTSALALACLCVMAACSSPPEPVDTRPESEDEGGPAARIDPVVDPNRPVVLAFGDSLTAGHMVGAAESYPARLQDRLVAEGYPHQVVNDGESGLTTSGGLARLDRALELGPDIVVVELGGNDGLRGIPIDVARENLRTIVKAFLDRGARVVLAGLTLPRNYGPDYIRDFEDMYVEIADALEVDLIPFFLKGLVDLENPTASIGTYMQADGTHPTAEGYTIVADTVFDAIRPYLED